MRPLLPLITLLLYFLSSSAIALTIEATGRALINADNIDDARKRAISRATEQASLMALAQISVTQTVRDGILEIDNLRVSTQTTLGQVELISERRVDDQIEVLIRAEVNAQEGCGDSSQATAYRKPLALTQWSIDRPAEANLGRLQPLTNQLPGYLIQQLEQHPHLKLVDARDYRFPNYSELDSAAPQNRARDAAALTSQYHLTARIESLAMQSPVNDAPNVLVDLAERSGIKRSDKTRIFELSAELIDSTSGNLLQRYRLSTTGDWKAPLHTNQPVTFERFTQQPYGQAVIEQINRLAAELSESIACQPLAANILSAEGTTIWINRGSDAGISPGDRLSVQRRIQTFDSMMNPVVANEPTDLSLTIERTEFGRAQGRLSQPSDIAGIQAGDIAVGY